MSILWYALILHKMSSFEKFDKVEFRIYIKYEFLFITTHQS